MIPKGMALVPVVTSEQHLIPRQRGEELLEAIDLILCEKVRSLQNQEQNRCVHGTASFASVLRSPGKSLASLSSASKEKKKERKQERRKEKEIRKHGGKAFLTNPKPLL